jgi:hypothetical protein
MNNKIATSIYFMKMTNRCVEMQMDQIDDASHVKTDHPHFISSADSLFASLTHRQFDLFARWFSKIWFIAFILSSLSKYLNVT